MSELVYYVITFVVSFVTGIAVGSVPQMKAAKRHHGNNLPVYENPPAPPTNRPAPNSEGVIYPPIPESIHVKNGKIVATDKEYTVSFKVFPKEVVGFRELELINQCENAATELEQQMRKMEALQEADDQFQAIMSDKLVKLLRKKHRAEAELYVYQLRK